MNTYNPAREQYIRILGRTSKREPLALFWTGSGIEFSTDGTTVKLILQTDYSVYEQWIRVEVDGYSMIRMPLQKGKNEITVFHDLQPNVVRHIRLMKEVQAMGSDAATCLIIESVETDGLIYPLPEPSCRLEIVGDSITSGEGLAGAVCTHEWVSPIFSTYGHYGVVTADTLGGEVRILSQSGWGVSSSWDNHPECVMPAFYEQVCGVINGEQNRGLGAFDIHDFASWQPDAVIVNLGANDEFAFENPPVTDPVTGKIFQMKMNPDGSLAKESTDYFEKCVYDFLGKLRKYNSKAQLIWVNGVLGPRMKPYLENAIATYQADTSDQKVELLMLPELKDEWLGANNHPGILAHGAVAEVLVKRLRELGIGI